VPRDHHLYPNRISHLRRERTFVPCCYQYYVPLGRIQIETSGFLQQSSANIYFVLYMSYCKAQYAPEGQYIVGSRVIA
jgi:hypothetical protein